MNCTDRWLFDSFAWPVRRPRGAVDDPEGRDGAPILGGCRHERELVPMSADT